MQQVHSHSNDINFVIIMQRAMHVFAKYMQKFANLQNDVKFYNLVCISL